MKILGASIVFETFSDVALSRNFRNTKDEESRIKKQNLKDMIRFEFSTIVKKTFS